MGNDQALLDNLGRYSDLELKADLSLQALWCYMKPIRSPSFTLYLLRDLYRLVCSIEIEYVRDTNHFPFHYFISASRLHDDIFNYGGDLPLFARLVREKNRDELRNYAHLCVNVLYRTCVHFNTPMTTIALVKGDAFAGGFESVLAHDLIIAEEKAAFGVPESQFGLFPGMGAYSFLLRRIGRREAERIIFEGKIYTASQMHEMGLVDVVAPNGKAEEYLKSYIQESADRFYTKWSLFRIRRLSNPVTHDELIGITDMWVEAAMRMCEKDISRMERIATAQSNKRKLATSRRGDNNRDAFV